MTPSASGGRRARAAKVVPSSPAVVNSINRTVTPIEPAWAGVALDNSRLAGLAGLNSTAISLMAGKVLRRISAHAQRRRMRTEQHERLGEFRRAIMTPAELGIRHVALMAIGEAEVVFAR